MKVHLFGATSSPSCAAFALRRTAIDNSDKFESEVISTVRKNFYVDDLLKSVPTEEGATKLATDLQSLMAIGGFRLTKWMSNSKAVLRSIPVEERAPTVIALGQDSSTLPVNRALGVQWNVENDSIGFKVKFDEKPQTKRGIVSTVSAIYDPAL